MDMTHKDWPSLQPRGPALPRDIKVAINYMRESIGQQICMADIVATTGTAAASCLIAFQRSNM